MANGNGLVGKALVVSGGGLGAYASEVVLKSVLPSNLPIAQTTVTMAEAAGFIVAATETVIGLALKHPNLTLFGAGGIAYAGTKVVSKVASATGVVPASAKTYNTYKAVSPAQGQLTAQPGGNAKRPVLLV